MFPFDEIVEPSSIGMKASKLNNVIERFRKQHASGAFPGGQLVVRRKGKVAVNVAIGVARGFRPDESSSALETLSKTLFPVYSTGKPLGAVAIAMLEDKGFLDINAPIADVFPEFAKNGKGEITTYDVLTHRSGILLSHLHAKFEIWSDKKEMLRQLVDAKPKYKRGTLAYQPSEFAWILSEIVSRIDGRELADYIEQEISIPLKLPDLKFGIPGNAPMARSYWFGKDKVMVGGNNVAKDFEGYSNSPEFFNNRNPSFSLVTNAASLAAFYECLVNGGITSSGTRLLSEKTLKKYTLRQVFGWDRTLRSFNSFGKGFMTGLMTPSSYGWWNTNQCFGHAGMFSCLAFGDYDTGVSVAITTNGNRGIGDFAKRFIPLSHACRKACL